MIRKMNLTTCLLAVATTEEYHSCFIINASYSYNYAHNDSYVIAIIPTCIFFCAAPFPWCSCCAGASQMVLPNELSLDNIFLNHLIQRPAVKA